MSFSATKWAFNSAPVDSSMELLVLAVICDFADEKTSRAFPSITSIASKARMNEKTVRKHIHTLRQKGLITDTGERVGQSQMIPVYKTGASSHQFVELQLPGLTLPKTEGLNGHRSTNPTKLGRVETPKLGRVNPTKLGTQIISVEQTRDDHTRNASPSAEADSPHHLFIRLWSEAFENKFGNKYAFMGGKDGTAASKLLKSGKTPEDLVSIAAGAWDRIDSWNCRQALSIAGFAGKFNEIQAELSAGFKKTQPTKTGASERIAMEMELKRVDQSIEALREEMQYEWDRTPERCSKLKALKTRKQQLETALSASIVIPQSTPQRTQAVA